MVKLKNQKRILSFFVIFIMLLSAFIGIAGATDENTESEEISSEFSHEEDDASSSFGPGKGGGSEQSSKSSSDTPVLDNFGIDLTKAVEEDRSKINPQQPYPIF